MRPSGPTFTGAFSEAVPLRCPSPVPGPVGAPSLLVPFLPRTLGPPGVLLGQEQPARPSSLHTLMIGPVHVPGHLQGSPGGQVRWYDPPLSDTEEEQCAREGKQQVGVSQVSPRRRCVRPRPGPVYCPSSCSCQSLLRCLTALR